MGLCHIFFKLCNFQTRPQKNCELYIGWGESDSCYDILNKYITHLFLTSQFSQLYVTVTACGAQNTDMINLLTIVLYLFFDSGFCVPPIHQELPRLDGFSSTKLIFIEYYYWTPGVLIVDFQV